MAPGFRDGKMVALDEVSLGGGMVLAEFTAWVVSFLARLPRGAGGLFVVVGLALDPDGVGVGVGVVWRKGREWNGSVRERGPVGLCGLGSGSMGGCGVGRSILLVFG